MEPGSIKPDYIALAITAHKVSAVPLTARTLFAWVVQTVERLWPDGGLAKLTALEGDASTRASGGLAWMRRSKHLHL